MYCHKMTRCLVNILQLHSSRSVSVSLCLAATSCCAVKAALVFSVHKSTSKFQSDRILHIIMIYQIRESVCANKFCNLYGLISFGFGARTKHSFEPMGLLGMAGSKELASLSCVRTQLILIIM